MQLYNMELLISPLLPDGGVEKLIKEMSAHSFFVRVIGQTQSCMIVEFIGGPAAMKKLHTTWRETSRSLTRSQ